MRFLFFYFALLSLVSPLSVAQISTDFEADFVPIASTAATKSNVTGKLPESFEENSSGWAAVDMHFKQNFDDPFEGEASLRAEVSAIRSGVAQIIAPVEIQSGDYGRIQFAARAPKSGSMRVAIRTLGSPYKVIWEQTLSLAPEWKMFNLITPPLKVENQDYIFMVMLRPGITDLDTMQIEFVDEDALFPHQVKREGNLMRNSSFPLGLSRPWTLDSSLIGATATVDPTEMGPTGVPALTVTPGYNNSMMPLEYYASILSPAIEANSLTEHTLSFYAKGAYPKQTMELSFSSAQYHGVNKSVTLSSGWKRYQVNLKLPVLVHGFTQITFKTPHTFWLDGVQFEETSKASQFSRSDQTEVVLNTIDPYGIHYDDAPLQVEFATLGEVEAITSLEGHLENATGEQVALKFEGSDLQSNRLTLPNIEGAHYGTFRVDLRALNAAGEPISHWSEAVLHRVRSPRHAGKDAPDSPFGIHIKSLDHEAAMAKGLGFNWVRLHNGGSELIDWYFVEPEPGVFDFSKGERGVDLLRSHHLMLLGTLDTSPIWYTNAGKPGKAQHWFSKYYIPFDEHLDEWAEYCYQTVAQFAGQIDYWEIWNEPYVLFFFRKDTTRGGEIEVGNAADYMKLLSTGSEAAKSANPDTTILFHDAAEYNDWHGEIVGLDPYAYSDIVALHGYRSMQPFGLPDFSGYKASLSEGIVSETLEDLPFWNTEGGPGGANIVHNLKHTLPADTFNPQMSDYLVRYVLANLKAGIEKVFLYTYHGYQWYNGWTLIAGDGALGPNASALSNLMWQLEDRDFVKSIKVNESYTAYLFEGEEDAIAVMVQGSEVVAPFALPEGEGSAIDLFGNPISEVVPYTDTCFYLPYVGTADELEASLSESR